MKRLSFVALFLFIFSLVGSSLFAKPEEIIVGTYLKNVESIDLQNNNYYLNFVLWFKWKGKIDPTKSFVFQNLIDEWGLTFEKRFKEPVKLADGSLYQRYRCEGRFFHKFWLGTFPLDWQKVTFELYDPKHPSSELIYVPDKKASFVNPDLALPGWRIKKTYNQEKKITFKSDFGMNKGPKGQTFSRYRFGLKIQRPSGFYFFKVIPPLFITLACCLLIFFLNVAYVDARVSTAIGALLTEVFLQLSFTANLPNVGIMMLIDHIFNFSYAIIFAILAVVIWTTSILDKQEDLEDELEDLTGEEKEKAEAMIEVYEERIENLDKKAVLGLAGFFVVGVFVITWLVRG